MYFIRGVLVFLVTDLAYLIVAGFTNAMSRLSVFSFSVYLFVHLHLVDPYISLGVCLSRVCLFVCTRLYVFCRRRCLWMRMGLGLWCYHKAKAVDFVSSAAVEVDKG